MLRVWKRKTTRATYEKLLRVCVKTDNKDSAEKIVELLNESITSSVITSSDDSSWYPPAVDLAPYFPYLTEKDKEDPYYLQELKYQTEKMRLRFDSLVFELKIVIENSKYTSYKDVVDLLSFSSKRYGNLEKILEECSNLDEVFAKIHHYTSFFNYDLIKHLARNFGSSDFRKKLKKYKQKFQDYAKRRLCEVPNDVLGGIEVSEKVYKIKIEDDVENLVVEDIQKLEYKMNKILGHKLLRLLHYKDGCVELTFRTCEDDDFFITKEQQKALGILGVCRISYGDEIFYIQKIEFESECDSGINSKLESSHPTSQTYSDYCSVCTVGESSQKGSALFYGDGRDLRDVRIDMIISNHTELSSFSPLYTAIKHGNLEQVKALVEGNENPMARDINGDTCLHYAVKFGRYKILKYLIEEVECPPGIEGCHGATLLHVASEKKRLATVKYLVEAAKCGLDPTTPDENGYSALLYACRGGNLDIVRYLIESMREYVKAEDILSDCPPIIVSEDNAKYKSSPLYCACYYGHLLIVQYLVEQCHCDPFRAQGSEQITPIECAIAGNSFSTMNYLAKQPSFSLPKKHLLHLAAQYSSAEVVKYLVQNLNCDFDLYQGNTPLHIACLFGKLDIVKYFISTLLYDPNLKNADGYQPIHCAASTGQLDIIKYLIVKHSVSAKAITDLGDTPSLLASANRQISLIKFLVMECGCDPSSLDTKHGVSSLHDAAAEGQVDAARLFVKEYNCNPNIQTHDGTAPLHAAVKNKQSLEFIKFLIEEVNCDPTVENNEHQNALHIAAMCGQLTVTKYLIDKQNIDKHKPDKNGKNIVHLAAEAGELKLLEYLISEMHMKGDTPDKYGRTPFSLASIGGHLSVIQYLLERGSKSCDDNSLTPLHYAAENGHLEIVKYIMQNPINQDQPDKYGRTPLSLAAIKGHLSVIQYLLERGSEVYDSNSLTPLHYAAENGHLDIVKYLMHDSEYQGMYVSDSTLPLKYAAKGKHLDIIKIYFVEVYGLDPCHIDESANKTLLHIAAENGCLQVVKYLICNSSCTPFSRDYLQRTPLYYCIKNGHNEVFDYLFRKLLGSSRVPNTVLHIAARIGDLDLVRYLVEEKQHNPSLCSRNGEKPIHYAAYSGNLKLVKYLVEEKHCDPMAQCGGWFDSKFSKNYTPLHIASMEGHLDIVEYLVHEKNVDLFCYTSPAGYTPLHYAAQYNRIEVARYLTKMLTSYPLIESNTNETPLQVAQQYGSETAEFLKAAMNNVSARYKLYYTTRRLSMKARLLIKAKLMFCLIFLCIIFIFVYFLICILSLVSLGFWTSIPAMEMSDYLEANKLGLIDKGTGLIHPSEIWDCTEAYYYRYTPVYLHYVSSYILVEIMEYKPCIIWSVLFCAQIDYFWGDSFMHIIITVILFRFAVHMPYNLFFCFLLIFHIVIPLYTLYTQSWNMKVFRSFLLFVAFIICSYFLW